MLLNEAVNSYIDHHRKSGSAHSTQVGLRKKTQRFCKFFGNVELESITPEKIRYFLISLQGLSPFTINTYFRALRAVLNWSVKQGLIEANPTQNVRSPRLPEMLPEPIVPKQQKHLLAFLQRQKGPYATRDRLIILLLLGTGITAFELCKLRVSDVNLESGSLTVRQGRLREDRTVPLEPTLVEKLSQYMTDLPDGQKYLFLNESGKKFKAHSVSAIGRKYLRELGLRGSVDVFRATFATNFMRNGGHIEILRIIMGLTTWAKTEKFVSYSPEDLVRAMLRLRPVEQIYEM